MEILAPAGSILSLKAAIAGGADAVYLGLGEHNARIKSSDFTLNNLSEWVSYAHLFGVKVYVTVNTAVKNEEMARVTELAIGAAKSGADALIVSDLGAVTAISSISDIPIHLSTQAGVQNSLDAIALKGLPIKRLILSRETPIEDISEIKKYADEIEVFVQGAMCVSFSGGCLLGSKIYGQSGNRGVCNQACRLNYTATDENGKILMKGRMLSPRDLCLGKKALDLASIGVDSIKIEGRLKRPAYVYAATKYYRDILDGKDERESFRAMTESFNRGYVDGYTLVKSKRVIDPKTSSHIGVPIGEVLSVENRQGYKFATVRSSHNFEKGDGVKILRNGIEVGGSDVTSVKRTGDFFVIPVSDGVKKGDELRLTTNSIAVKAAEIIKNKLPIELTIGGRVDQPIALSAKCGEITVSLSSDSIAARSDSSDNSAIIEKLSKVGNSDFSLEKVTDQTDGPLFIKVSEINALRREVLDRLREAIIASHTPSYRYGSLSSIIMREERSIGRVFEISDFFTEYPLADAFVLSPESAEVEQLRVFVTKNRGKKCYLRLPRILRNSEIDKIKTILRGVADLGIYTDNLYGVALARELKRGYVAGFGLNLYNDRSVSFFSDADAVCGSLEEPISGDLTFRAGKVALMSFAHCPFSVAYGMNCASCIGKTSMYYQNEDGRYLIQRRVSASCDFTMYQDKVSLYPILPGKKNLFYRFIGLNAEEKRDMMRVVSEDIGE